MRKAVLAASIAGFLVGCGGGAPSKPGVTRVDISVSRSAALAPFGQNPLRVKGAGFVPRERVTISTDPAHGPAAKATASARGTFTVALAGVKPCDSVSVTARGNRGSRASFNLSTFACSQ